MNAKAMTLGCTAKVRSSKDSHKTSHKREDVITTHVKTTFSRYFKCNAVDKYLSKLLDDL